MRNYNPRSRVALLHITFWCIYLTFSLYQTNTYASRGDNYSLGYVLLMVAIDLGFLLSLAYLNYFFFLPRWLEKKNLVRYLTGYLIPFAALIILKIHLTRYLIDHYSYKSHYFYSTLFIVQVVSVTLFIVIFVGMLRFAADWFEFEAKKKEVENEKLTAELNFLKAQINPHFLFNTLNNLYYLAYTKSPNTTEVIAKLSQMMRYMIYDSNHPKVLLNKEIEYMENYISLEKLRLNNQVPIEFTIKGNTENVAIAPLILITFLENAFKHGVSNSGANVWIRIMIEISGKECIYQVSNSKIAQYSKTTGEKSGIGLQNVKRRLELSYPGKYELKVREDGYEYSVELRLSLDESVSLSLTEQQSEIIV